jgi:hypothetical protein
MAAIESNGVNRNCFELWKEKKMENVFLLLQKEWKQQYEFLTSRELITDLKNQMETVPKFYVEFWHTYVKFVQIPSGYSFKNILQIVVSPVFQYALDCLKKNIQHSFSTLELDFLKMFIVEIQKSSFSSTKSKSHKKEPIFELLYDLCSFDPKDRDSNLQQYLKQIRTCLYFKRSVFDFLVFVHDLTFPIKHQMVKDLFFLCFEKKVEITRDYVSTLIQTLYPIVKDLDDYSTSTQSRSSSESISSSSSESISSSSSIYMASSSFLYPDYEEF